jgi:long-chain fatty acid transport protein
MKPSARIFLLVALAIAAAAPASADDGNYQNYTLGERGSGMAGAVIATTRDLDAAFYNPAGLGFITADRLSLSTSIYGLYRYTVFSGLGPDHNYCVREFETIPSSFGSVINASDRIKLSFSAFIPDDISYNHQESFRRPGATVPGLATYEYFSYIVNDQQLWIGPSLGYLVNDRFSLGASVFVVYRSMVSKQNWTVAQTTVPPGDIVEQATRIYDIDFSNYGLLALLGAQYRLTDHLFLGATVQTPVVNLRGTGELLYAETTPVQDILIHSDGMKSLNRLPARFSLGAAWRETGRFAVEADVTYHLPVSYSELEGTDDWTGADVEYFLRRLAVVNANLGGEYYVMKNYPLRAGFFTNISSAPEPDPLIPLTTDQIDMYGVTLSVGNETEHTTINVGLTYVWGDGKTLGYGQDYTTSVVETRESYLLLSLSSSYIF